MGDLQFENAGGTFSISHRKALGHHMPISHFHSTFEIHCLISGKRELFVKDRTISLQDGDVVIISPNILHRTTNANIPEHERLVVNIHEKYLNRVDGAHEDILSPLFELEYMLVRTSPYERLAIDALLRQIMQELQDRQPGFERCTQALVIQLLILCCRHRGQDSLMSIESPSPMHDRISEVVCYINTHYMQPLSLRMLADRFYVSPYYLSRFFKEATGFTFVEYMNSVRVKEAKKLLEGTNMKAGLIAKKVGFGSVTNFGRVFKSVTGHAPLFFRKGRS
ncbi:helix-turn-helix domain-containing protein [Paenibacillus sp. HB172176]|uniref:helix-turn-helix transcriptional regulator n=1 Tax=Paenibacillus sp. HB172176 TaxID=2493690 RepID=UPI00143A4E64|nr:helix-turn-helix domain-containing protein [Paenibacillus sp. HB172176]